MNQSFIEIAILAFVAAFILFRLYATLGKRTGAERPDEPRPQPAPQGAPLPAQPSPGAIRPSSAPASGPAGEGLMAIVRADPNFEVDQFASGARAAYEWIVSAFAKGDTATLETLLTPRVYQSYAAAIAERQAQGGTGPELVRLRTAEIVDAGMDGDVARVSVKFEAELAEGAHGVRDAREKWTFERDVRSPDPNWRLARVVAA